MTLRFRLIAMLSGLFVLVMCAAATALISNTRANVGAESRAALGLIDALLGPLGVGRDGVSARTLAIIAQTRHLRVEQDRDELTSDRRTHASAAPGWFSRLVAPADPPPVLEVSVATGGGDARRARVLADPRDEVNEAWDDLSDSAGFALALLAFLNLGTFFIVRREIAPLDTLNHALRKVEDGALDTRMPIARLPEIQRLCVGFNHMVAALAESKSVNRELTRSIIGMQEAERRALARELHDEFGQHLTAIRADAAALLAPHATIATARLSGRAIEDTSARMMQLLRSMLERLRPEALDALGLCAALEDLIAAFRARNPDVAVSATLPDEIELGEEVAIALFRVAQEALTNIARHASAGRALLSLVRRNGLTLCISDDGCGMPAQVNPSSFGLAGMRERIESCGGRLEISNGIDGRGTSIRAILAEVEP